MTEDAIKLTEYSHGAGCGCKISPKVLDIMLASKLDIAPDPRLLVGNSSRDDAAAYEISDGQVILSTTDFFMPIVDDAFDFGRIAATNAISDIYAMGGTPIMAIAILGWPVGKLPAELASKVLDGARSVCADAGIMLAGGHSIDAPEPIFGLAVTGQVLKNHLKQNNTASAGCDLYLTKPLGVGVLTTAQKQKKLEANHANIARDVMCQPNSIGAKLSAFPCVKAMTDVTGFGLMGHLSEMCEGSGVKAIINAKAVPILEPAKYYLNLGCVPGGTERNFESYGHKISAMSFEQKHTLCDPQTSGGLLIAADTSNHEALLTCFKDHGLSPDPIGHLLDQDGGPLIEVH